jgi:hypothetical protein
MGLIEASGLGHYFEGDIGVCPIVGQVVNLQ